MILLNHRFSISKKLIFVKSIDEVSKTPPNSTLRVAFDEELISYLAKNSIDFGIEVNSIKEVIFASHFGAKYIISSDEELILKAQKVADSYLFDSKIIYEISDESVIEFCALNGIDGVLFKD